MMPRLKHRKLLCSLVLGCCLLVIHQYRQYSDDKLDLATINVLRAIGNRNTSALVLPDEKTIVLQPVGNNCQDFGLNIFALFVVISAPENKERRDTIRSTLGSSIEAMSRTMQSDEKIKLLFFLGLPDKDSVMDDMRSEFTLYEDMIVDNFTETYLNLTLKTLRMLKWTLDNCHAARYLVKIDDDVHLNLHKFIDYLQQIPEDESGSLISGHKYNKITINKNPYSKWFTPSFLCPKEELPDFAAGFLYVLGSEVLPKIYNASLRTPLFHLEDAFLTGFVATNILHLQINHIPDISVFWSRFYDLFTSTCSFQNYMAIHMASPYYLHCWNLFNSPNFPCGWKPIYLYC